MFERAPGLARADFRREYGISRDDMLDLDAVEFIELLAGLSGESRFHTYFGENDRRMSESSPATVRPMKSVARTHSNKGDYLAAMRQHRGRVVEVGGDAA